MRIGYAQTNPVFGEKEKNLKRALKLLEAAAGLEADLVVLPELFNTGYVFRSMREVWKLAEQIPDGYTSKALLDFAEENGLHVCAGICEATKEGTYNSALLAGPSGHCVTYRKIHLFGREKLWFMPGNAGLKVFAAGGVKVGIMICFDWFFPESARVLALGGAQVVCHPANLVLPYCQTAMLGSALQNKVFVVTANRTGVERSTRFTGRSQIVGPDMRVLARSGLREDVKVVKIRPEDADDKRVTRFNDLFKDRRPEMYGPICSG
ncbi:MAG: acyltransferase [Candidatus Brockarchaeota archaeon]|nr:acyltransferase [Candidatus Brockarchaeota archaeon]